MPVCSWGDTSGERYREAYFDMFPGVWRHGANVGYAFGNTNVVFSLPWGAPLPGSPKPVC